MSADADQDVILDDFEEEGRLISLAEVKHMLTEAQEAREEMTYEQKIAMEHARRFARIEVEAATKVVAAVEELLPGIEQKYAIRVADLLPLHPDDVRGIFQKSRHELDEDTVEKIIDIVDANYVA